jgi:nucleotide-binding universal stress UspA family protein
MFHKILVAIDTSASAKDVFDKALFLAKASKGQPYAVACSVG